MRIKLLLFLTVLSSGTVRCDFWEAIGVRKLAREAAAQGEELERQYRAGKKKVLSATEQLAKKMKEAEEKIKEISAMIKQKEKDIKVLGDMLKAYLGGPKQFKKQIAEAKDMAEKAHLQEKLKKYVSETLPRLKKTLPAAKKKVQQELSGLKRELNTTTNELKKLKR